MTSPEQWRYVSTKDNPADHLTRGMATSTLACNEQWWKGPEFLQMDEVEWPQNQFEMSKDAVTEQKKSGRSKVKSAAENQSLFADAVSTKESTIGEPVEDKPMKASKENSWPLDPSHFSSWLRLTRLVAWVCRFLAQLSNIDRRKNSRGIDT